MPTAHEYFKKQLTEQNVERFKVTDMTDVTYEFLECVQ